MGFAASAAVHKSRKPLFVSEAKLLVKYVLVRENMDVTESQINVAGGIADHVINTEIEILKSGDLAITVAEAVGVHRLLPESSGEISAADGASAILNGLEVTVVPRNNVIHISYSNQDRELSKEVLRELIKWYFVKHLEIHRSANAFDLVAKQSEDARARLKETERELDTLKTRTTITSLTDATSALAAQRVKTQEELLNAKAELAELKARVKASQPTTKDLEEQQSKPNLTEHDDIRSTQVPAQIVTEYMSKLEIVAFLRKRELELQLKFKPGNRLILLNRQQIEQYDARRSELVGQYPMLETVAASPENKSDLIVGDQAQIAALTAKIEFFSLHLEEIKLLFREQYAIGAEIEVLERKKGMEDAEYRSLVLNLKNAKLDQTLDPSRMPNITMVQHPSEPVTIYNDKEKKIVLGLAGAGVALGIGLAFLIELLLDRRVQRPFEIQARLQLPLLLTIPYIRTKDRGGMLLSGKSGVARLEGHPNSLPPTQLEQEDGNHSSQRKTGHFILPYAETIRDRIIFNFVVNDVIHKPKLIAVTGLSAGAGASTIAAGLAKSFSEVNGAKVLLVDLSSYQPEESPIFGEIARHSLNGALQLAKNKSFRESGQNLYFASATARRDDSGLTTFSPIHLYELLPHLQVSGFDYIIFEMPPLDQTSRTLTMAGLMDKVLLVLDAKNTSRDSLKWGYSELVKGKADVSCVFNKSRSPAPGWLVGEA